MKHRFLVRRDLPVACYAIFVFFVATALIAAVVVTLDRNAKRSSWQQNVVELRGGARVGASAFRTLRANLRVQVSELASSLPLQRAVVTQNDEALRQLAQTRHARIVLHGRAIGVLGSAPRIASTANITDGAHVLASVTVALPLGERALALIRQVTPLRSRAGLMLVRDGRVIAGGPAGAPVRIRADRVILDHTMFAAAAGHLGVADASVVAVEPVSAISAQSARYRRLVFLVAAVTLALAAALAVRVARPFARVLGDVARLSGQARTDALSGLANRRALNERLEDELARADRNGTSVSFVLADIDGFKPINDGFGHQTGDKMIRAVADVIGSCVREMDLAARFGGEEFALVLPGSPLANGRRVAERIRRAVAEAEVSSPTGETAKVTVSFGVAEYPTYGSVEALVAAADAALYQAKRGGKNQVATATVRRQSAKKKAARSLESIA